MLCSELISLNVERFDAFATISYKKKLIIIFFCRYVCGAANCNYLCLEESMLRHHLIALHTTEQEYMCQHCLTNLSTEKSLINVDAILKHLKLHDTSLYSCLHCKFINNLKHKLERHMSDKHPDKPGTFTVVREAETESIVQEQSKDQPKVWKCGMCKQRKATKMDISIHAKLTHNISAQYKCSLCSYESSDSSTFKSHFNEKHAGQLEDIIQVFFRDGELFQTPEVQGQFDTTPLWSRDKLRIKHIRGILLDDSGKIPKKPSIKISTDTISKEEKSSRPETLTRKLSTEALVKNTKKTDTEPALSQETPKKQFDLRPKRSIDYENKTPEIIVKKPMNMAHMQEIIDSVAKGQTLDEPATKKLKLTDKELPILASLSSAITITKSKKRSAPVDENMPVADLEMPTLIQISPESKKQKLISTSPPPLTPITLSKPQENNSFDQYNEDASNLESDSILDVEDIDLDEEMGLFGPYGKPLNGNYFCPLCNKVRTKVAVDFVNHLYEELEYSR